MSYDEHCAELARIFIEDASSVEYLGTRRGEVAVAELAQLIQNAVEDWFLARKLSRKDPAESKVYNISQKEKNRKKEEEKVDPEDILPSEY